MPNLVPMTATPQAVFFTMCRPDLQVSASERASHEAKRESFLFMIAHAERKPVDTDRKEVPQADRKGTVQTSHDTLACKLRQFQRLAGIEGVTRLDARYEPDGLGCKVRWTPTAKGTGTHTVNLDRTGLCPREQEAIDPSAAGSFDMSHVARYAGEYRGTEFAKSAARDSFTVVKVPTGKGGFVLEFKPSGKRERRWFLAAFPYWPLDNKGQPMQGKQGKSGRYFDLPNGVRVTLAQLREDYLAGEKWVDDCADELRKLQQAQADEAAFDKKHSKRTRMAW